MRFGVCLGLENPGFLITVKNSGFDYTECGFSMLSQCDDSQYKLYCDALKEADIKCEAANRLIPGDMPLVGKGYNKQILIDYLKKGMFRGAEIGLETVVLGSGKARDYPGYMTFSEGFYALSRVIGDVIAPIADEYGITVAIEPLRKSETKIINTVKEGVMLASAARRSNVSGLVDLFHMYQEGDTFDDLRQLKGNIKHAHLATPYETASGRPARSYPASDDEYDYKGFFESLEYAGCIRCSVEASSKDIENDLILSGELIKKYK